MTVGLDDIGNLVGLVGFHVTDRDVGGAPDDPDLAVQIDGDRRVRHVHGHRLPQEWRKVLAKNGIADRGTGGGAEIIDG